MEATLQLIEALIKMGRGILCYCALCAVVEEKTDKSWETFASTVVVSSHCCRQAEPTQPIGVLNS
jgi:hypothetical protein